MLIDYEAVLQDLRGKRDRLNLAIEAMESFATTAAPLPPANGNGLAVVVAPAPEPDPRKRPRRPSSLRKKKAADAKTASTTAHSNGDAKDRAVALARQGKSIGDVAAAVKRPYATVYTWLCGAGLAGKKKAAAKDEPARRLCAECGQKGVSDPCEHCGEAR